MKFAQLDADKKVLNIIEADQAFVDGQGGDWKEYDDAGAITNNPASIGSVYDAVKNAFIPEKPAGNPSFVLDETRWVWIPPTAAPEPSVDYLWDEGTLSWLPRS